MRTALITGITGQDGAYLARFLLDRGYRVIGAMRRTSSVSSWRLQELGIAHRIEFCHFDLLEPNNIAQLIITHKPDEIYNLAAQSFVAASFDLPVYTAETDGLGALRVLDAVNRYARDTKFYQASTSEMFGKVEAIPQDETTPFHPRSPYGIAKLFAHWTTVNYREAYGLFACSGILFNHESPLRGREFVTRKITSGLAMIRAGGQRVVRLGNIDARRDWGFAADYVEGMWMMLQAARPNDYVLATGVTRSIRDFASTAAGVAGYDLAWEGEGIGTRGIDRRTGRLLVEVDPGLFRPAEVDILVGNPARACDRIGWEPRMPFDRLVSEMVETDIRRLEKGLTLL